MNPRPTVAFSPYAIYSREEWARLRADTPMTLSDAELENLSGLIERISTNGISSTTRFGRNDGTAVFCPLGFHDMISA